MSSTPSSPDADRVDVWLAHDADVDAASLERFAHLLSPDERRRVDGMQFEAGRRQQLVTRALARIVLSHYRRQVRPEDWRFGRGEHGRPCIAADFPEARRLDFNLAHAEGLVVMAVGSVDAIGVDVERIDARVNLAVARRYFSPAEAAALDALPPEERPRRFQRLWTLKEAYLKAIGTGIVGGLGSMTFHVEGDGVRFERASDPDAASWRFREFEVGHAHRVALACRTARGAQPAVQLRYLAEALAASPLR